MSLLKNRLLWSVAIGHFTVDVFANLTPMMLPLLMVSLDLDYTRVALVATMYTTTSSLAQPMFGHLADKYGGRLLAPLGIVWTSLLIALVGFAPSYPVLLAIMFLAGLGSAAFHPQGAMNASMIGGERKGSAVSVFMLGGNIGYSLGPMIGAALFMAYGLKSTTLLLIPGLLLAAWLYQAMSAVESHRRAVVADANAPRKRSHIAIVSVASLVLIIMARSWTTSGLNNFLPLWYGKLGFSAEIASQVLFVMLFGLAVGGLCGGFLSDWVGRRKVVFFSLAILAPTVYLFLQVPPPYSLAAALPLGLLAGASTSITIVMAQELLPQNMGMASGLTLGLAFVTGGIGVTITGNIADNFGLFNALNLLAFLPLVGALLVLSVRPVRAVASVAG